jgi:nucleotide-binding universal stress UspA family protein
MTVTPSETGYAVVAVDGSEEGDAAVAFAADEALRRGLSLRLAHVMPSGIPVGPLETIAADHALGAYASETLAGAARLVADAAPGLEVTTHALAGGRVTQIVELARHASVVVVGRRAARALDRAWSGGTLDGVVSRAGCPVFVVPEPPDGDSRRPVVVAGFKSTAHSAELFEAAFRAADELGVDLDVVHAWKLNGFYDDIIIRRVSEAATNRDQKAVIWETIAPWLEAYPEVRVKVHVVHDHPVRALIEAARGADRLVLVNPARGSAVHHLGRTARGVLRFATCPIEVVPARGRQELEMPPVVIEQEGRLVT